SSDPQSDGKLGRSDAWQSLSLPGSQVRRISSRVSPGGYWHVNHNAGKSQAGDARPADRTRGAAVVVEGGWRRPSTRDSTVPGVTPQVFSYGGKPTGEATPAGL